MPSAEPATTTTPDGWVLTVSAKDETQRPVAPLTTAATSREYVVGGTFTAAMAGPDGRTDSSGTFEVGYQIGCGIDMSTGSGVSVTGNVGIAPSIGLLAIPPAEFLPTAGISAPIGGGVSVGLKPGFVTTVPVVTKKFEGSDPWVSVSQFHVTVDGCVGESFIRSYATLIRSTSVSDSTLSYVGLTKAV